MVTKVLGFTGEVKSFPEGTTVSYNWTLNGVSVGSGEVVTVDLVEGDNVILLDQVGADGSALAPQVTATYNVPKPVTVDLTVANAIVVSDPAV